MRGLIPQQFVDAGLGAGFLVDALDDDRTCQTRRRRAIWPRLSGKAAGHDDRVGWHLALENFAARTVDVDTVASKYDGSLAKIGLIDGTVMTGTPSDAPPPETIRKPFVCKWPAMNVVT